MEDPGGGSQGVSEERVGGRGESSAAVRLLRGSESEEEKWRGMETERGAQGMTPRRQAEEKEEEVTT